MAVVFITIPGEDKLAFAERLHKEVKGGVAAIYVQKRKAEGSISSIRRYLVTFGFLRTLEEFVYALLLRLRPDSLARLRYFRENSLDRLNLSSLPVPKIVESVNNETMLKELTELAPDVLVVWGCAILSPQIIGTAKEAVNLHLGLCPHYRGALANQHAVLDDNLSAIGATIHFINGEADAGDIIETVEGDPTRKPQDFFRDINDRAWRTYIRVAREISYGQLLPRTVQEHVEGKLMRLRDWTPKKRYLVSRKLAAWEKAWSS